MCTKRKKNSTIAAPHTDHPRTTPSSCGRSTEKTACLRQKTKSNGKRSGGKQQPTTNNASNNINNNAKLAKQLNNRLAFRSCRPKCRENGFADFGLRLVFPGLGLGFGLAMVLALVWGLGLGLDPVSEHQLTTVHGLRFLGVLRQPPATK